MRALLSLYAVTIGLCFSRAYNYSPLRNSRSHPHPKRILEPRQAPGVIAASDFLRRGYQTSVVVGSWVYIDGGEFSFMNQGTPQFQYASTLLSIDLSQNWTNATIVLQSTTKPNGAPSLNNPSLWYHEPENLIYSGFAGWNSSFGDDPNLPPLSLWTFKPDEGGSGIWKEIITAASSIWSGMTRPAQPLMASSRNNAWILGGVVDDWDQIADIIPGMLKFDMVSRSFSNSSIECCNATGGIYRGALQHVPSFGPAGIYIAMGGQNGMGSVPADGLVDFGTVSVFDPAKQEWWNQTTTGSAPSPRVEFCTAGINSTNGTYEIFVYAGWGTHLGPRAVQFDTINILTLPGFHWISVPYNPESPRHAHSCNAVGGSQILTIGGVDSNSQVTGGIIIDIIESTFDTSPDPFTQGLAIFDMTTMAFSDQYTAGAPPYEQSEVVKQFYSQSDGTYINNLTPQVSALFEVTHFTNSSHESSTNNSSAGSGSSNTTSNPPIHGQPGSSGLKAGAVAGIAVGGSAALLAIVASIRYINKRARTLRKPQTATTTSPSEYKELAAANIHYYRLNEMDGAGRTLELQEQGIQELEQPQPRMELAHP